MSMWPLNRYLPSLSILLGSALVLSACGGGGGSDSATETGSCVVTNVVAEPDMLQTPSFVSANVAAGGTVTLKVPVDADTRFIIAVLTSPDRTNMAGSLNYPVISPGEQTLSLDIVTTPGATAGNYFPMILTCTDLNACIGSGTGTAISYTTDAMINPGPNFVRFQYYIDGGAGTSSETCMPVPYVTIE